MGPWGAGGGDKAHPEHVEAFCPIRAGCGHVSYHVCNKSFVLGLLLSSSVGVFGGQRGAGAGLASRFLRISLLGQWRGLCLVDVQGGCSGG